MRHKCQAFERAQNRATSALKTAKAACAWASATTVSPCNSLQIAEDYPYSALENLFLQFERQLSRCPVRINSAQGPFQRTVQKLSRWACAPGGDRAVRVLFSFTNLRIVMSSIVRRRNGLITSADFWETGSAEGTVLEHQAIASPAPSRVRKTVMRNNADALAPTSPPVRGGSPCPECRQ